jgi:hypothetical protein
LLTDIELFLENHISSLRGLSSLKLNNIIEEDTSIFNKNENSKYHEDNVNIVLNKQKKMKILRQYLMMIDISIRAMHQSTRLVIPLWTAVEYKICKR